MEKLNYIQLNKDNEIIGVTAKELWIGFIKEVSSNDGKSITEEQIIDGFNRRVSIQGSRKDMHFEVAFLDRTPIGIAIVCHRPRYGVWFVGKRIRNGYGILCTSKVQKARIWKGILVAH